MNTSRPVGLRVIAPYITSWTAEMEPPLRLVEVPGGGLAYADETLADRDSNGVLWSRTPFRPGEGRPDFGRVHPMRQRRAMRRMLCQVCAGPADRSDEGMLWLLQDHREDWPNWPERMGVTEPPVCLPCVSISMRLCPALRRGAVAVRARRFPITGVRGGLYAAGWPPRLLGDTNLSFNHPDIRWARAVSLTRELADCTLVEVAELRGSPCQS